MMLTPLSERAMEYDDEFGDSICIKLKNQLEYEMFKKYLLENERIRQELEHGRESMYRLVKDIPIEKLDILDRERYAVINFCNYILANQITERSSE